MFWHFVLSLSERKGREVVCAVTLCSFPFGEKEERSGLCCGPLFFPLRIERGGKWFVFWHFVLSLSEGKGREVVCVLALCSFPFGEKGKRSCLCCGTIFLYVSERRRREVVCAVALCSFPFGVKGERSGLCSGTLFFPFRREIEEKWFVL